MKTLRSLDGYVTILCSATALLAVAVFRFLYKLYHVRSHMLQLKKRGLPMPPYHPLFGHLPFAYKITSKLPKDAHPNYLPDMIRRELPDLGPVYYINTWPFGPLMLVVSSPDTLHQALQERNLPKYHALRTFLLPIADGIDIVTMEGQLWKTWRGIFNPGFSPAHLLKLTPAIVEETVKFCDILKSRQDERRVIRLKDLTDFLALDVIGRVVLDIELDSQRQSNSLVDGLRNQIGWLAFGGDTNPLKALNPMRYIMRSYNSWRMNRFLSPVIDDHVSHHEDMNRTRSILDLAVSAYFTDGSGQASVSATPKGKVADPDFKLFVNAQVKQFLFSGHDTTSASICYLFYALSCHSSALKRLRAEHDEVFGPDIDQTAKLLSENPILLNKIPFTTAIIKETLRLYPSVSSVREGESGFNVTDEQGRQFPTAGCMVWGNPHTIQRDPAYWPSPDEFIPDRWLVPPGDSLHPVKGAWRAFEWGPRNCIGQELAMMEMKIILALTVRRFNIIPAYEEIDRHNQGKGVNTVLGERGYQITRSQPSGDLPCWVKSGKE
ncbi:hypothetical protein MMC25_007033 [Agyrium rufum]|nr:hypothetical protein [Agyrium rufum]